MSAKAKSGWAVATVLVGWLATLGGWGYTAAKGSGASETVQQQHTEQLKDHETRIRSTETLRTDIAELKRDAEYTRKAVERIETKLDRQK